MSFGTLLMVNEAVNQPNSLTPECKLDLEFRSVRQRLLYERCAVRVFYLANGCWSWQSWNLLFLTTLYLAHETIVVLKFQLPWKEVINMTKSSVTAVVKYSTLQEKYGARWFHAYNWFKINPLRDVKIKHI